MPIYEYRCNTCGKVQEVFHKSIRSVETVKCYNCGSEDMTRLISVANVSVSAGSNKGLTCCGREERCDEPPCTVDGTCKR